MKIHITYIHNLFRYSKFKVIPKLNGLQSRKIPLSLKERLRIDVVFNLTIQLALLNPLIGLKNLGRVVVQMENVKRDIAKLALILENCNQPKSGKLRKIPIY